MKTSFYLRLEPRFTAGGKLKELKPAGITQRRPLVTDGYVIKMSVTVPDEVFEAPEVDVQVRTAKVERVEVKTEKPAAVSR